MNHPNMRIFGDPLFEGIINKTLIDKKGIPFLQIRHLGAFHEVRIAFTQTELQRVKQLDDEVFGRHQGVSLQELNNISNAGRVLVLEDQTGVLVAQSQILTSPISEYSQLGEDEAYCYGTAVKPGEEGKGYAQIVYKAQEVIAREARKQRMTLTVRVENARSIRARLHSGFRIIGYDAARYGSAEEGGARFVMEKWLIAETLPFDARRQAKRVKNEQTPIL